MIIVFIANTRNDINIECSQRSYGFVYGHFQIEKFQWKN